MRPACCIFGAGCGRFLNGQVTQDVRKVIGTGMLSAELRDGCEGGICSSVWRMAEVMRNGCWCFAGRNDCGSGGEIDPLSDVDDVEVKDRSGGSFRSGIGGVEMEEGERIEKGIRKSGGGTD